MFELELLPRAAPDATAESPVMKFNMLSRMETELRS
jgi:hypothetical protein